MVYHIVKLIVLLSNYQFPPMTLSHLIVNWLLCSVSGNVPHLWTLSYKGVKHINNGTIMWIIMK